MTIELRQLYEISREVIWSQGIVGPRVLRTPHVGQRLNVDMNHTYNLLKI